MLVEPEIIEACIQRDNNAQKILFDTYKSVFMGIATRYLKDTGSAKDVVQDAFVKIFTNLPDLNDHKLFDVWARRIVVNTSLNAYKKSSQVQLVELSKNGFKYPDEMDLQAKIIQKLDTEYLLELINTMPEGYRLVFNLYLIDGYSHKEISVILGIAESTSRSQLTKAKKFLQQKLDELSIQIR